MRKLTCIKCEAEKKIVDFPKTMNRYHFYGWCTSCKTAHPLEYKKHSVDAIQAKENLYLEERQRRSWCSFCDESSKFYEFGICRNLYCPSHLKWFLNATPIKKARFLALCLKDDRLKDRIRKYDRQYPVLYLYSDDLFQLITCFLGRWDDEVGEWAMEKLTLDCGELLGAHSDIAAYCPECRQLKLKTEYADFAQGPREINLSRCLECDFISKEFTALVTSGYLPPRYRNRLSCEISDVIIANAKLKFLLKNKKHENEQNSREKSARAS